MVSRLFCCCFSQTPKPVTQAVRVKQKSGDGKSYFPVNSTDAFANKPKYEINAKREKDYNPSEASLHSDPHSIGIQRSDSGSLKSPRILISESPTYDQTYNNSVSQKQGREIELESKPARAGILIPSHRIAALVGTISYTNNSTTYEHLCEHFFNHALNNFHNVLKGLVDLVDLDSPSSKESVDPKIFFQVSEILKVLPKMMPLWDKDSSVTPEEQFHALVLEVKSSLRLALGDNPVGELDKIFDSLNRVFGIDVYDNSGIQTPSHRACLKDETYRCIRNILRYPETV